MSVVAGRAPVTPLSDRFIAEVQTEFPRFRIVQKRDSALSRVIDVVLRILTLGAQRSFMTHYHTVLWDTLYVPDRWALTPDVARLITLHHERVHLRQRRRYGDALMTFLYLVPFFPLGLAYGRARIEWEAYAETIRVTARYLGPDAARDPPLRSHIVSQFTSGSYGWMWPFRKQVERWYDAVLAQLADDGKARETTDPAPEA